MLEKFILLFVFALPSGNIHVAHEGAPNAEVMSAEECKETAARRIPQAKPRMKWIYSICAKVEDNEATNDRPFQVPLNPPKPRDNT